jgi:DNA primase
MAATASGEFEGRRSDGRAGMAVTDEIKDRLDIVEVVGETVKLRRSGKNYTGFCPFHANTRTPAFVVFPESGTWRCFGACNDGGDIFKFVMKKEGWDFPETLRVLARRAGVELQPLTPEREAQEETNERLRNALESSVTFFRHQLLQSGAGADVLVYLHKRGLTDEAIERFELGYAPDSWDGLRTFLAQREFTQSEGLEAGLLSERQDGGAYDRFRNRIMFPIRDGRGRMAGFGARIVNPQDQPKFLNSPQTPLFDKGKLLYGLDKARKAIRQADQVVLVEGYLDVIALHQAGYENVVSAMGTALSEGQFRQLKRFTRQIVLALDADAAGDKATLRGLTLAREALDRETDPVFDARGLVRHEGRLDADLRIVTLPEGRDPDEVVLEDPQAWPALLQDAPTVVAYVLDVLTGKQEISDPRRKAEIARHMLPLIEDVADPIEREAYRQHLARRLKLDERALNGLRPGRLARGSGRGRGPGAGEGSAAVSPPARQSALEHFCLGALLRDPEWLYRIDRQLQSLDLDRLTELDFTGTERQVIFQSVRASLTQDDEEPAIRARGLLEDPVRQLADEMLDVLAEEDFTQPRVIEEVEASFLRLRHRRLDDRLQELRFQIETAQELDSDSALPEIGTVKDLAKQAGWLGQQKDRLDRSLARRSGSMDALAILSDGAER